MRPGYKIAFIQLTRIGDVIQTYTAAKQLKEENPELELTLIARRKFSGQLDFLLKEVFTNIVHFDTKDFLDSNSLKPARSNIQSFIRDISKFDFDLVVNLSFNKSSSYLTTLIKAKLKIGLQRNRLAEIAIPDKWSQFIYSNVMTNPYSPFNLIDIYKYMTGAKEIDLTNYVPPQNGVITIHPFASSQKKSWGTNKWGEVIYKLLKDDPSIHIKIVGAPNECEKANQLVNSPMLATYLSRITNNVGTNTVEDTFLDLANSQLFIGHDSMVSHLAALFRMPSLVISLGTVRPHETSPYNDKAYILSPRNKCFPCTANERCDLLPCHTSINYQTVVASAKLLLQGKAISWLELSKYVTPFHIDSTQIFSSSFDEFGISLREITQNNHTSTEVFRLFYRVIWSFYLAEKEVKTDIPEFNLETVKLLNNHIEGTNYLFELYGHGFKFSNNLLSETEKDHPSVENIQNLVAKISEIDELGNITKKAFPYLAPLVDFFYVNRANSQGNNIIEISRNNLFSYNDSTNLVAALAELIERSIAPRIGQMIQKTQGI